MRKQARSAGMRFVRQSWIPDTAGFSRDSQQAANPGGVRAMKKQRGTGDTRAVAVAGAVFFLAAIFAGMIWAGPDPTHF